MKVALSLSLLMVGCFFVGFYVLSPFFPMEKISHKCESLNCEAEIAVPPVTSSTSVKNWGYTNDYCLRKLKLKDTSIILIPRCEF